MSWVLAFAGVVGACGAATFMTAYHATAPWWRSQAGRHMMASSAVILLVLGYVALRQWLGAFTGYEAARAAVFWAAALWPWGSVYLLLRAQPSGRHRERRR